MVYKNNHLYFLSRFTGGVLSDLTVKVKCITLITTSKSKLLVHISEKGIILIFS